MAAKITRLPQPASHTIEQVFDEFLGDQRRRLRPRTLSKYEDVLGLLRDHLNGDAYQSLSTAEAALFDRYDCEHDGVAVRAGLTPAYE